MSCAPRVLEQIKTTLTVQYADLNPAQLRRDILTLGDQLLDLVKAKHAPTRLAAPRPADRKVS